MRQTAAASPFPLLSALNKGVRGMAHTAENPAFVMKLQRRTSADSVTAAAGMNPMHGATSTRHHASSKRVQLCVLGLGVCGTAVLNLTTASRLSSHLPCVAYWSPVSRACSRRSACTFNPSAAARQATCRVTICHCKRVPFSHCASRLWTSRHARR